MSHSAISLGLGLGGGKSATSSGAPGGGGVDYSAELEYTNGLFAGEGTNYDLGSTSPRLHFMTDYTSGVLPKPEMTAGDVVTTWADCSGNNTDFTQSTESQRGVYQEPGGVPGMNFEWTATTRYDLGSPLAWSQEMTIFVVGYSTGTNNGRSYGPMGTASVGVFKYYPVYSGTKMRVWEAKFGNSQTFTSLNLYSVTRGANGSGAQAGWYNGGTIDGTKTASNAGVSSAPMDNIGFGGSGTTGYIMEIIYFESELSNANKNLVGDYIANKYSLTIADWT